MRIQPLCCLVLTCFILPRAAAAADTSLGQAQTAKQVLRATGVSGTEDTVIDARTASSTDAALMQISASGDGGRATIKLAHSHHDNSTFRTANGVANWRTTIESFSLVLSAPTNKSGTRTDILSSSALPGDFQAKIGFSQFIGIISADLKDDETLREDAVRACYKQHHIEDKYIPLKDAGPNRFVFAPCDYAKMTDLIATYLPASANAYQKTLNARAWVWGVEGGLGYDKFDYFDAVSAAANHSTSMPWSVRAYGGLFPSTSALLLLAGIEYQDAFDGAKTGTLCPTGIAPVLACVTGAVGAPTEKQSLFASLEGRREFQLGRPFNIVGINALGIDPKFSYDLKQKNYGFDLPLSFVTDEKKNLVGGMDLGWKSDTHNFVVGLFFGTAFDLSPG